MNVGEIRAVLTLETSNFNRNLAQARRSMTQAGAEASNTGRAVERIGSPTAVNNLNRLNRSAETSSKSFDKIQKAALGLGGAVALSLGASIKTAADFEAKLSNIKSVSGATGSEMKQLGDLAKQAGKDTVYSSSQAADAIAELLKSGLSVSQVLNGGLTGALSLASAGELELGDAAEIASTALNAFRDDNLTVAQSADILAGAASASATDVGELKYGLSAVSAVASGAGLSFKDTSLALAVFAQNGLRGSDSGTSLKTMLMNLSPSTKAASEKMKDLGIITKDGANHFYTAEGKLKSLSDVTDVLRKALEKLNPKERGDALKEMFGSDAVRAGTILFKEGAQGVEKMAAAMDKIKAADVAKTKLDNLHGAVEALKGSLETAGINLGEEFLPLLTDLAKAVTEVVNGFDAADVQTAKSIIAFAGVSAAVGTVLTTIAKVGVALSTFALTPVGAAIIGLSLLSGAFVAAKMHADDMNEVNLDSVNALEEQRNALSDNIKEFDGLRAKNKLTNDELDRFVDINSNLKKTADPGAIAALKDEQEKLRIKSGLSNDEFDRMLDLNGKIIEIVPQSNTRLTDQGTILLNNTDAAKKYNDQQLEMIRLELEAQKAKAEANMEKNLVTEKNLMAEMKQLKKDTNGLDSEAIKQQNTIKGIESDLAAAKRNNDTGEINRLQFLLGTEKQKLGILQDQAAEGAKSIVDKQKEIDKVHAQIGKLDEVKRKMVDIELRQVGINAKRGEEMLTLDRELAKLDEKKRKLGEGLTAADKNTQEYRDAAKAIDSQIQELLGVKSRIQEITGQAGNLNYELGKPINKTVTVNQVPGRTIIAGRGNVGSQYHTGGITGRGQMPMLHTGGAAWQANPIGEDSDESKLIAVFAIEFLKLAKEVQKL